MGTEAGKGISISGGDGNINRGDDCENAKSGDEAAVARLGL